MTVQLGGEDDALKLWSMSSSQEALKLMKPLLTRGTPVQSICWTHANFLIAAGLYKVHLLLCIMIFLGGLGVHCKH